MADNKDCWAGVVLDMDQKKIEIAAWGKTEDETLDRLMAEERQGYLKVFRWNEAIEPRLYNWLRQLGFDRTAADDLSLKLLRSANYAIEERAKRRAAKAAAQNDKPAGGV